MNDQQLLRYSRQIMLPQVDIEGQERLLGSHALVVGAGGLGLRWRCTWPRPGSAS